MLTNWAIWISWRARADWTVDDAARRLVASLRLLHEVFGEPAARFKVGGRPLGVDDPDLLDLVAGALRPARDSRSFPGDTLGDAGLLVFPAGHSGYHVNVQQIFTARGGHEAWFRMEADETAIPLLSRHSGELPGLIARLGALWSADSGWLDLVHVRQEWNRWTGFNPVASWATWLSPDYDDLDLSGAGADITRVPEGGRLIVLRVALEDVADPGNEAARDAVQRLAARLP